MEKYIIEDISENESDFEDSSYFFSDEEEFLSEDDNSSEILSENNEDLDWIPHFTPTKNEKEFKVKAGVRECKAIEDSIYPVDFFYLLFSKDLLSNIIEFTNKNASVKIDNNIQRKNKLKQWKNLTFDEMTCFIGLLISFGLVKKSKFHNYWETSNLYSTKGLAELLSRERFSQIFRCLIFRDIEKNEKNLTSKYEILQFHIISNSQLYYLPRQNLSIDESLISFHGRSKIKIFLPLKRKRYGLKALLLCDSSNSYVWNWDMYKGISESVVDTVMKLCIPLEGENYYIFMDRFYTTVNLFIKLRNYNFYAVGTVMPNRIRKNKKELEQMMTNSNTNFFKSKGLFLIVWKDKKIVSMLSNVKNTILSTRMKWNKEEKKRKETEIPDIASRYIDFMGGIDRFDQVSSYHSINHKSKRWPIKLFFHFLDISLHNSKLLYEETTKIKINHEKYRKKVVKGLICNWRTKKNIMPTKYKITNIDKNKIEVITDDCKLLKRDKKSDCAIHKSSDVRARTIFYCGTCDVALCPSPCYDKHRLISNKNKNC